MTNKIAFITGASSGIGEATARLLAAQGFDLILNARRQDKIEKLANELSESFSVKVLTLVFDVRIHHEVKNAIENLNEDWKNIAILVNNAGLASGLSPIYDGDLNDWEAMIDTNVKGLLYVSKYVLPIMKNKESGHVINIGSIAGKEVYNNGNVYCATKHAVDALNKGMRIDLLPHGIKVSAINPGMVETEFSIVRFDGDEERAKKVYENIVPLKPEDIAETIYWMATRPAHVNINDVIIMPTIQANATTVLR